MQQNIKKTFAKYVSQDIFGMLGVSCYIIADTFFISLTAGADGITVLNLTIPVYGLIFAIGSMIGIGSATKFAILRAQGREEAENYFSTAVFWALLIGSFFIALGIFAPHHILRLMGGDQKMVALGVPYVRIFLLFTPFFMANYIFSAFIRNDQDPSLAMTATMASSLFNVVFDYIFMFPLKMGLAGAALATAVSPVLSILICSLHFLKKDNTIHFRKCMPSVRILIQSCKLGVPAFIGEFSSSVTTTVFNFLILGLAGNIGVAAYGVVCNFALVATAIFNGIAQGSQPLLSEAYGKNDQRSLKTIFRLGTGTAIVSAAVIYAVVSLCTGQMIALFNQENSAELAAYAYEGLRIYFSGFFFAGINIVGAGYLSSTDRAVGAFGVSLSRGVVAIVAASVILSYLFGFRGIWLSFAAAEAVTALLLVYYLRKDRKEGKMYDPKISEE